MVWRTGDASLVSPAVATPLSLRYTLNSVMCKIYKVKFQLLDSIYRYTSEIDIADVIKHRQNILCWNYSLVAIQ